MIEVTLPHISILGDQVHPFTYQLGQKPPKEPNNDNREVIKRLLQKGMQKKAIAHTLGIHPVTLSNLLKRYRMS